MFLASRGIAPGKQTKAPQASYNQYPGNIVHSPNFNIHALPVSKRFNKISNGNVLFMCSREHCHLLKIPSDAVVGRVWGMVFGQGGTNIKHCLSHEIWSYKGDGF